MAGLTARTDTTGHAASLALDPHDLIDEWPKQPACIRVEYCCLVLREILPESLYLQVRTETCRWDQDDAEGNAKRQASHLRRAGKG